MRHSEQKSIDDEQAYDEALEEAFEAAIRDGVALQKLDNDTESLHGSADLVASILRAYRNGGGLLDRVEALHDKMKRDFEEFFGEEVRERIETSSGDDRD